MNSFNKLKESPRKSAGFISRLLFWWITPLIWKGWGKAFHIQDLYKVLDEEKSNELGNKLEKEWDKEEKTSNGNPSLFSTLFRLFGPQYLSLGIIVGIKEFLFQISQPLILGRLIRYFDGQESPSEPAWLLICGLLGTSVLYTVAHHTYFFWAQRQGMRIRVACSSLIYRKALDMNLESLRTTTSGQITNLLANDVNRFDQVLVYLHFIWAAPIQMAIVIYILWGYFGAYCLTGVLVLILFVPVQGLMGKLFGKFRSKTAIRTDSRIRLLTEVITAIRVIKMQAWELLFASKVVDARESEISRIKKTSTLRAINLTLHQVSSKLIIFITLLIYVLVGNKLTAEKVFVTIALYSGVRRVFTYCVPMGICNWAETKISIQRIQEFLLKAKTLTSVTKTVSKSTLDDMFNSAAKEDTSFAIRIKDFSAKWDLTISQLTLNKVTLDIPQHSLIAVVGKTGSGKSSLLCAILKELTPSEGEIFTNESSISYASQEGWIFEGTIRDNITFGLAFESNWYSKVVDACALREDLLMFPFADMTFVGEKGSCLSGGQRARINLARAVYSKSEIILLDDPLSSVDANVAKHIMKECVSKLLVKKTCILVTHQLQYLPKADKIILLDKGMVKNYGSYEELLRLGVDFHRESDEENVNVNYDYYQQHHNLSRATSVPLPKQNPFKLKIRRVFSTTSEVIPEGWIEEILDAQEDIEDDCFDEEDHDTSHDEPISAAQRSRDLYWKYIRCGTNIFGVLLLAFLCITTQALYTGSDFWLQIWVKSEQSHANSTSLQSASVCRRRDCSQILAAINEKGYDLLKMTIYAILFGSMAIVALLRTLFYFKICMDSSIKLHDRLFTSVLAAPITFFQENPTGRILNIFAANIGIIDELLPATVFETIEAALGVSGVLVVVSIVNPILLLPSALLLSLLLFIRLVYIGTARNIKRLETITKGPVFSHTESSLNGLVTIRAFNACDNLRSQFDIHQDLHSSAWFLVLCTTRWLAFIVEFMSVTFIGVVAFSFLLFSKEGSAVGLAISSAMTLSAMFQWGFRQSTEAENQLISVERVSHFSNIVPESQGGKKVLAKTYSTVSQENSQLETNWPSNGEIEFQNFNVTINLKNNDLDTEDLEKTLLHHLSFSIRGGEKIGVVGRTGAGKSTLVSSLFRLVNPNEGKILIDGKDISSIDLKDLRRSISIIPQEPVLFDGTLRQNLDPEENRTDPEIWDAIRSVKLEQLIQEIPAGLNCLIIDNGSNFSVGEKQLLCLGRALLQQNKILVLDEATSSLDKMTDDLVQKTIRENFSNCTTITIAHRLDTIIDCDKIIVLDAGSLMEFDSPSKLLENKSTTFYKMVAEMGESVMQSLIDRAREVSTKSCQV